MSVEQIVRPFETVQVAPAARNAGQTESDDDVIVLKFGEEGQVKTLTGSHSASITGYVDEKNVETSRTTTKKRVENPDDPSQFVDVEIIKKLTTERGSGDTYKKSTYELKNT